MSKSNFQYVESPVCDECGVTEGLHIYEKKPSVCGWKCDKCLKAMDDLLDRVIRRTGMKEKEKVKCTHPDHVEGESCEDRAVGCSPDCKCCMGDNKHEAS